MEQRQKHASHYKKTFAFDWQCFAELKLTQKPRPSHIRKASKNFVKEKLTATFDRFSMAQISIQSRGKVEENLRLH